MMAESETERERERLTVRLRPKISLRLRLRQRMGLIPTLRVILILRVRPREKVCHRFGYMYNCELYFIENNTKITVKTWYGPLLQQ